jgi:hypothetical protein
MSLAAVATCEVTSSRRYEAISRPFCVSREVGLDSVSSLCLAEGLDRIRLGLGALVFNVRL